MATVPASTRVEVEAASRVRLPPAPRMSPAKVVLLVWMIVRRPLSVNWGPLGGVVPVSGPMVWLLAFRLRYVPLPDEEVPIQSGVPAGRVLLAPRVKVPPKI